MGPARAARALRAVHRGLQPAAAARRTASFAAQTALVHAWRRFPFIDPDLPDDLLPRDWPRRAAYELFKDRHEHVGARRPAALRRRSHECRKRIYVAYVGGTIGMKATDNGYAPVPGPPDRAGPRPPELHPRGAGALDHRVRAAAGLRQRPPLRLAADRARHRRAPPPLRRLRGAARHRHDGLHRVRARLPAARARQAGDHHRLARSRSASCAATGARTSSPPCSSPPATTSKRSCLVFGSQILRGARAVKASASGFEAFTSPNLPPLGEAGVEIEIDESRLREPAAGRDRAAADARRAGRPAAAVPRHAGLAAARGAGRAHQGPGPRGLRRRHRSRRRPRAPAGARRGARRGVVVTVVSQCVDGRVDLNAYATSGAADRGRRGRRARHDHRGRLREARRAALRGPRAGRGPRADDAADLAGELTA